jgi:hypothetical protein
MPFQVNERVRVNESRWAFGGVMGTVVNPPDWMAQLDPEPWNGNHQFKRRKDGVVVLYWIDFDVPTDDGSGDGPYTSAAIEEENLIPLVRS